MGVGLDGQFGAISNLHLAYPTALVDVRSYDVQCPLSSVGVELCGHHQILTRQHGEVKRLRHPFLRFEPL